MSEGVSRTIPGGLLVSVRSACEATEALAGGAMVIDVKEPERGALGAVSPDVLREIVDTVAGRAPVTAALGELVDVGHGRGADLDELPFEIIDGVRLLKVGLSRAAASDWRSRWQLLRDRVRNESLELADLVAVAYADAAACDAPAPGDVIDLAVEESTGVVLIDTFVKDGSTLLDHLAPELLESWASRVHAVGGKFVLAGSVRKDHIPTLLRVGADIVAVRGAATTGRRVDRVCRERVLELARAVLDAQKGNERDEDSPRDQSPAVQSA